LSRLDQRTAFLPIDNAEAIIAAPELPAGACTSPHASSAPSSIALTSSLKSP